MWRTIGAGLAVVGAMSACSSAPAETASSTEKEQTMSASSGSPSPGQVVPSGTASAFPTVAYAGDKATVSVATVVLPRGQNWVRDVTSETPTFDEQRFTVIGSDGSVPSCAVIIGVQSGYDKPRENYEVMLNATPETLKSIQADPAPPEGGWGVVARYAGGPTSSNPDKKPFASVLRTWKTPGGTKITVTVVAEDPAPQGCDGDAIVGSLTWSGSERPLGPGGSASPTS